MVQILYFICSTCSYSVYIYTVCCYLYDLTSPHIIFVILSVFPLSRSSMFYLSTLFLILLVLLPVSPPPSLPHTAHPLFSYPLPILLFPPAKSSSSNKIHFPANSIPSSQPCSYHITYPGHSILIYAFGPLLA